MQDKKMFDTLNKNFALVEFLLCIWAWLCRHTCCIYCVCRGSANVQTREDKVDKLSGLILCLQCMCLYVHLKQIGLCGYLYVWICVCVVEGGAQTECIEELCVLWWWAWLHQKAIWLVLKVPTINPQTLVLSRRAHLILVKDASSVPYSNRTAGASSTWQSRSHSLRHTSAAVALIHCLSRETGPVGDIQGLSWVPPSRLPKSVSGGLNWKRENDVQGGYSVVRHNDPVLPLFSTTFSLLHYFVVSPFLHFSQFCTSLPLSCLPSFLVCFLDFVLTVLQILSLCVLYV